MTSLVDLELCILQTSIFSCIKSNFPLQVIQSLLSHYKDVKFNSQILSLQEYVVKKRNYHFFNHASDGHGHRHMASVCNCSSHVIISPEAFLTHLLSSRNGNPNVIFHFSYLLSSKSGGLSRITHFRSFSR